MNGITARRLMATLCAALMLASSMTVGAASAFGNPAFQQQWQQGEALAPNFWGPLATAKDGQQEPYKEAPGGQRLVQYFDKGRMELGGNGAVTNGLLANELFAGQVATANADGTYLGPPGIPIAGDPDGLGPTYASLATRAKAVFDAAPARPGFLVQIGVEARGDVSLGDPARGSGPTSLAAYDSMTQHNVLQAFGAYRDRVGLAAIGYAKSEPFVTTVKVGGAQQRVVVQVFERRVLTYTASNPEPYTVEMGNIGQHYSQWRYSPPFPAAHPGTTAAFALSPITLERFGGGNHGQTGILGFTVDKPACLGYEVRRIGGALPVSGDWMAGSGFRQCTLSTSLTTTLLVSTGDKVEVRGFARDLMGNTVYTPNTVIADATTSSA